MTEPTGELTILREYTCGCLIYLDEAHRELEERGLFCAADNPDHRSQLTRGQESQPTLF